MPKSATVLSTKMADMLLWTYCWPKALFSVQNSVWNRVCEEFSWESYEKCVCKWERAKHCDFPNVIFPKFLWCDIRQNVHEANVKNINCFHLCLSFNNIWRCLVTTRLRKSFFLHITMHKFTNRIQYDDNLGINNIRLTMGKKMYINGLVYFQQRDCYSPQEK